MQPSSNYTLLFPEVVDWEKFSACRPDVPFSDGVVEFLNALSGAVLKDAACRSYPDVVTFAFFCRKSNILKLREQYIDGALRLGRGILFHIAPSNVPINFAYTLVAGLLAGNANIVRVSSKAFPQVDLVVKHLQTLLASGAYDEVVSRIVLVRYDRTSDANAYFSSVCNVRVIWGGDATIAAVRKNELPARSFDVCFADRYSIAAINPKAVMAADEQELKRLAENFYNDTYLFDQNACSAPHIIFWFNDSQLAEAKRRFWQAVYEYTEKRYQLQAVMSVDKLTAFYRQSVFMDIKAEQMPDNLVVLADVAEVPKDIEKFRCACGYFSEHTIEGLDDISPMVNIKYQTLAYYGFEKEALEDFVRMNRFQGLDRIVPIGKTTNFSLTWDGYDLIRTLTRIIDMS